MTEYHAPCGLVERTPYGYYASWIAHCYCGESYTASDAITAWRLREVHLAEQPRPTPARHLRDTPEETMAEIERQVTVMLDWGARASELNPWSRAYDLYMTFATAIDPSNARSYACGAADFADRYTPHEHSRG